MSHAINPDVDVEDNMNPANTNGKNNNNNNNSNNNKNSNDKGVSEMKTQDKVKIMASQMKEKSKENAKKMAEKTKDRLSLEGQLRQAKISLERFVNPKILNRPIKEDTLIPKWVLKKAKGIVFLTVIKAGFLFAGNVGTGCVIVRKPNGGWTGPSSIAVAGVSFGFLAGASKVDYLMILPDDAAVKQFTGNGQLRLGAEVQVALGPVGREASGSAGAGDKGLSVIYSYSHAQGLYGGLAFDGKVMSVRPDCNDKYYGKKTTCFEILTGEIEAPLNEDYDMIVHLLDSYCNDDLTPMKGERISIDDLDKETNRNYENDSKYNNNNNNGNASNDAQNGNAHRTEDKKASEIMDEIGVKFQSGFNNLKTMIFNKNKTSNQATFEIGNADDTNNNNNNNNSNDQGIMKSASNSNNKNNSKNNNNSNMSISPQSNHSSDVGDDHRPPY